MNPLLLSREFLDAPLEGSNNAPIGYDLPTRHDIDTIEQMFSGSVSPVRFSHDVAARFVDVYVENNVMGLDEKYSNYVNSIQSNIDNLNQQLSDIKSSNEAYKRDIKDTIEAINRRANEISSTLGNGSLMVERTISTSHGDSWTYSELKNSTFSSSYARPGSTYSNWVNELNNLNAQTPNLESIASDRNRTEQQKQSTYQSTETTLYSAQREYDNDESQVNSVRNRIQYQNQIIDDLRQSIEDENNNPSASSADGEAIVDQSLINHYESEIARSQSNIATLNNELESSRRDLERSKNAVDSAKSAYDNASREYESAQRARQEAERNLNNNLNKISRLESNIANFEQQYNQYNSQVQTALSNANSNIDQINIIESDDDRTDQSIAQKELQISDQQIILQRANDTLNHAQEVYNTILDRIRSIYTDWLTK